MRTRRTAGSEGWLVHLLADANKQASRRSPPGRLKIVQARMITELAVFAAGAPSGSTEGLHGRTTGSLAWRRARGEVGGGAGAGGGGAS